MTALAALLGALSVFLGVALWKAWADPSIAWLASERPAEWILYPSPPATKASAIVDMATTFERRFELRQAPTTATLRARFFRRADLLLNGRPVSLAACPASWKVACEVEVGPLLLLGENRLEVQVSNAGAPPALWLSLRGSGLEVSSDATWDATLAGATTLKARLARQVTERPRFDPLVEFPSPLEAVTLRWPAVLGLAALAAAIGLGLASLARALPTAGGPEDSPWPLRLMLGLAALAWVALFLDNLRSLPLEWGFDASGHLDYVRYLLERRSVPLADQGWQMFQPPLYYALAAAALASTRVALSSDGAVVVLRLLGMGIGITHVLLVGAILRRVLPGRPGLQAIGAAAAAFLPCMLYLHHFPTNEILAAMLATASLLVAVGLLQDETWAPRRHVLLGVLLGLSLLAKFSTLLLLPPILGALGLRALASLPRDRLRRVGVVCISVAAMLVTCGWHFGRVWARFGDPFVGGWEARAGMGWWLDPGYRTAGHFLRFGRALTAPLFAGYNGIWDGLYATLFGDGLLSGLASATPFPPWWSSTLQPVGYLLALVPATCAAVGAGRTLLAWLRRWSAVDGMFLSLSFLLLAALVLMSLRVPCVAEDRAFYGLMALSVFAVFVSRGFDVLAGSSRARSAALVVALGTWAATAYATYWTDPDSPKVAQTKATALVWAGDERGAVKTLRSALARAPEDWGIRTGLARALMEGGGPTREVPALLRAGEDAPDLAPRHLALALFAGSRGDFDAAISSARRAAALDPDDPDAWAVLASALEASGRPLPAIEAWREVLRIQPQDPASHDALASLYQRTGQPAAAALHRDYAARVRP